MSPSVPTKDFHIFITGDFQIQTARSHLPLSGDVGGAQFCFHAKIFNDKLVLFLS